ncbi:hypothetical protein ACFRCX_15745 [Streptomyces sp. NPDC056652]|uniref:hypothetical protein n=1 Tax=Streptomyces sp. NPDC056652 TaxID=3345893 RepID=UPI0036C47BFA
MTTRFDDGPEFEPDDPFTVLLRPSFDNLGPPAGRYEAVRRAAVRRRRLRTAARAGVVCVVAALIVLPVRLTAPGPPASPTVPLAPPPVRGPSAPPPPTKRPGPVIPRPGTPGPATTAKQSEAPSDRNSTDATLRTRGPAEADR